MNFPINRCEDCDKTFPSEVILSWHRLSGCKLLQQLENLVVSNSRITPKSQNPKPQNPKPRKPKTQHCTDCNKLFKSTTDLKMHMKSTKRHNPVSATYTVSSTTRLTSERVESITKYQSPHHTDVAPRAEPAKNKTQTTPMIRNYCGDCKKHFNNAGSLSQHLKSAKRHKAAPAAPFPSTARSTREGVEPIAKYQPPNHTDATPRVKPVKNNQIQPTISNYYGECKEQFKTPKGLEKHMKLAAWRHDSVPTTHTSPRITIPIHKGAETTTEDLSLNPTRTTKLILKKKAQVTVRPYCGNSLNTTKSLEQYLKSAEHNPVPITRKAPIKAKSKPKLLAKHKSPYDKDAIYIQKLFSGHQLCEKFPWYQYRKKLSKYKSRDDNAGAKREWKGTISARSANKVGGHSREKGKESFELADWYIPGKKGKRKANWSRKGHDKYMVKQTEYWEEDMWLEQE